MIIYLKSNIVVIRAFLFWSTRK